jgi:hypothetical protein
MPKTKKIIQRESTGDDIQINFDIYLPGGYIKPGFIRLNVVAMNFQSATNFKWEGRNGNDILTVEFDRQSGDIVYSDNFPPEHKSDAADEVRRITRQFN